MIASAWLGLAIALSIFAWFANRRIAAITLPIVVLIAAGAMYVPLGHPRPGPPAKGQYVILGLDIIENVSIKVLLKAATGESTFYVLPYSNKQASDLQGAQDDAHAEGGQPQATFGGDGDMTVGITGKPEAVKPIEPAIALP